MSLSRPLPSSSKQVTYKSMGNTTEKGGQDGPGVGLWGDGDQAPILQYLHISITYSFTAGKATKKSNFENEKVKKTIRQMHCEKIR